jgi:alpha-D-ribose 1-methylphosphonate 5-triphosphate synthase subunit PhnG
MSDQNANVVDFDASPEARRAWMGVLARAPARDLAALLDGLAERPVFAHFRAPESGLVMTRGRAGGTGEAFNLGEMTVTRAALRTDDGIVGIAYVPGRDKAHAERAALVDAMMQGSRWRDVAQSMIVAPLAQAARARRDADARRIAATKVEFFTMVRERTK